MSTNRIQLGAMIVLGTALMSVAGIQLTSALMIQIPNEAQWASSGHADVAAEAFNHWEGTVPVGCAKCHSTGGYIDFLGADGTEAGVVDNAPPVGSTVECIACHNAATEEKDSVVFPSGVEIAGLGASSRCMECHQGRESGESVATAIADANLPDDDTVSSALRFKNIHYMAAGATLMGAEVHGGYQYAGKSYDVRLTHVEGLATCVDCHDPHTLEIKMDACATCHELTETLGLEDIRFMGSLVDYDGDGDMQEGIAHEIEGLKEVLYSAMQAYGRAMGAPIVYDAHSYPYFFADANDNGVVDEGEGAYASFTARLLKASFNYQVSVKDAGAYAHNPKYLIQLLYDTIEDLDPAWVIGLNRNDSGHFAGSKEAFRHWDAEGRVSSSCSKCHSADGLPFLLAEGVTVSQPTSNGFKCSTCHDSVPGFTRYDVGEVVLPSGAVVVDTDEPDSNICMTCHQGRASGASVAAAVAGLDADTVISGQRFINVHYFAAAATRYGAEAGGAYEYAGKEYKGFFKHTSSLRSCTECHDAHMGDVAVQVCIKCHREIEELSAIRRTNTPDFDGDGDTTEGLGGELDTMVAALLSAMEAYAANVVGEPIAYDADSYPYFMKASGGTYNTFTPRLLEAAYNLQFVLKDPGAFTHNGRYVLQVLYDGIEDLGGDVSAMTRP
ncbi:MAG: hypothetical protein K9N55_02060 [Phycisphaerae bacterium]|nr:hypothetical protein [Phycisphaerae bacterium]